MTPEGATVVRRRRCRPRRSIDLQLPSLPSMLCCSCWPSIAATVTLDLAIEKQSARVRCRAGIQSSSSSIALLRRPQHDIVTRLRPSKKALVRSLFLFLTVLFPLKFMALSILAPCRTSWSTIFPDILCWPCAVRVLGVSKSV
ncbi:hypothetical protein BDA96_10G174500 [Sorghum bicolor]|uniref:Uncharacterized protein n=1 Tax=Sorghum bicolor TaxID=4558 RepID=A0A921Q3R4_SORBI|nr:hypothetical protein BDA96_10G174500 [Sorghum bicolor]